ncbi:sortase-dependent protein [Streptomyces sp. NPDC001348]
MRRTVISAAALACVAVLASTVPAFADSGHSSPGATATVVPSARASTVPTPRASSTTASPGRPAESAEPTLAPSPVPSVAPGKRRGQVGTVPLGAPDTGVAPESHGSGSDGMLIGGGAAGAFALGGAAFVVVRRRRATGA